MFDKFGEFDSAEELNAKAEELKAAGEEKRLVELALENGLDKEDAEDYMDDYISTLATTLYDVHGITKVYVRQSEDTKAGYAGSDKKYKYIVQGNRFTLGTTKEEKSNIATAILNKVQGVTYTPFSAECTGLPYLEVGDPVQFYVYDFEESDKQKKDVFVLKSFYVLSRTLKGIQSLTDTLTAQGEEKQRRFVSDLGVREDVSTASLKEKTDKQDERIKSLEDAAENGLKVESVTALPASPDPNTIYLIQGTVG